MYFKHLVVIELCIQNLRILSFFAHRICQEGIKVWNCSFMFEIMIQPKVNDENFERDRKENDLQVNKR